MWNFDILIFLDYYIFGVVGNVGGRFSPKAISRVSILRLFESKRFKRKHPSSVEEQNTGKHEHEWVDGGTILFCSKCAFQILKINFDYSETCTHLDELVSNHDSSTVRSSWSNFQPILTGKMLQKKMKFLYIRRKIWSL